MRGVYPAAERQFRPWKNGGGQTAEIAVSPAGAGFGDFDWRISTAIVATDGPFSCFPDVTRVLTVIEGGAMRLRVSGQVHLLDAASPPLVFPGEAPCAAELTAGPLLNAMTNIASGATWVSLHHGGGVGMGFSQHSGVVIVADGTPEAAKRLERVLWNDPASGVMRHADAGYDIALDCARDHGLRLPGILG